MMMKIFDVDKLMAGIKQGGAAADRAIAVAKGEADEVARIDALTLCRDHESKRGT
jgi:hypothetical protein